MSYQLFRGVGMSYRSCSALIRCCIALFDAGVLAGSWVVVRVLVFVGGCAILHLVVFKFLALGFYLLHGVSG
jgi:hypothetical protein